MAFLLSNSSKVLYNDHDYTSKFTSYDVPPERELADVTTLADSGHRFQPGLLTGKITLGGLYDSTTFDSDLFNAVGADNGALVSIAPEGTAIGKRMWLTQADASTYKIPAQLTDMVKIAVELQSDDGIDIGVSLHDVGAAQNLTNGTTNFTSVDNGVASSNGGVGFLHLTVGGSGGSTVAVDIQDSADNATFATIATFATVATGTTSAQRVVVAAGAAVRRYVRARVTGTAVGTATFAVAFARR